MQRIDNKHDDAHTAAIRFRPLRHHSGADAGRACGGADPLPGAAPARAAAARERRKGGPGRSRASGCTPSATCSSTCRATAARRAAWPTDRRGDGDDPRGGQADRGAAGSPARDAPAGRGHVADATGTLRVTFFNQPWLADRYPPGTRLMLHGKADGRGRFTVQGHAPTDERPADARRARLTRRQAAKPAPPSPTTRPPTGSPRRRSWRWCTSTPRTSTMCSSRCRQRCGCASACWTGPGRCAPRTFPPTMRTTGAGTAPAGVRRAAAGQLALQQRRRNRPANAVAPLLAEARELTARWLEHELPFPLTGDQRAALEVIDADIARGEPMQRLLMGEVGSGKTVVALVRDVARGRARLPGSADGTDRDAGRAALPDASEAARLRACERRAADRLNAGPPSRRPARQARRPASCR